MKSVEDLDVFKLAHGLTLRVYKDLGYISRQIYEELGADFDRVSQMLTRLSQSLDREPRARETSTTR